MIAEFRRTPLWRSSQNSSSTHSGEKGLNYPSVICIEPWVTSNLLGVEGNVTRKGGRADERASQKGKAQEYPTVGTRALLQPRAYVGGPRLLRRGGHLLRAQGQGERHSALHFRNDRGPEDSRGRRDRRLPGVVERAQFRRIHLLRGWVNKGRKRGLGLLRAPAHRSRIGYFRLATLLRLGQLVPDVVLAPPGAQSMVKFGHSALLCCSGAQRPVVKHPYSGSGFLSLYSQSRIGCDSCYYPQALHLHAIRATNLPIHNV